ncbi:ap-3 complex subunit sigma-2 [Stylonychia lemnae]|uniref:Ap-3 complex subunit sigma-2 n=1 Tax=Stylonychia lemnae TaxID=5949 RepID=A0A078B3U3_STYLE|nr:ap-3 complex subunit sigma-2 [Stylonychia lemnae]|eukprot:CDW89159.1 ap-3 complex subunit sigma-2 [Stylonychia lemnae]
MYRVYATLTFVFVIDDAESELAVLDLIQVLVEVLDKCFENLNYIIDEIVVDGMVTETNINEIVSVLKSMNDYALEK